MIRVPTAPSPRAAPLLRCAALVLVAALAVLAVAGAVHLGDDAHGGAACPVCDAIASVGGAAVPAAAPAAGLDLPADAPGAFPPRRTALLAFEPGRIAAPRGPPGGSRARG